MSEKPCRYGRCERSGLQNTLAEVRAENVKLRDKLLELAKECAECNGTGLTTGSRHVEPCEQCADIREVLA